MFMEIIAGVIGIAFVVLVVFLLITLQRLRKAIRKTDKLVNEVHHLVRSLAEPCTDLVQNANKLVLDFKKKSDGLDVLFRPLYSLKKPEGHKGLEKIGDVLGYITEGIQLFNKIKNEMKR